MGGEVYTGDNYDPGLDVTESSDTEQDQAERSNIDQDIKNIKTNLLVEHADVKDELSITLDQIVDGGDLGQKVQIQKHLSTAVNNILNDPKYATMPSFLATNMKKGEAVDVALFRDELQRLINDDSEISIIEDKGVEIDENKQKRTRLNTNYATSLSTIRKFSGNSNFDVSDQDIDNYKQKSDVVAFMQNPSFLLVFGDQPEKMNTYLKYRIVAEKTVAQMEDKLQNGEEIPSAMLKELENFNAFNTELGLGEFNLDYSGEVLASAPREQPDDMGDVLVDQNLSETMMQSGNESISTFLDSPESSMDALGDISESMENFEGVIAENIMGLYGSGVKAVVSRNLKIKGLNESYPELQSQLFLTDGTMNEQVLNDLSEDDRQLVNQIVTGVKDYFVGQAKLELGRQVKELVKEKALASAVRKIGQYFENVVGNVDMADDFATSLKDGVKMQQLGIPPRWEMTLAGNLDGFPVEFYYDLTNGVVQSNDFLYRKKKTSEEMGQNRKNDNVTDTKFEIGVSSGRREYLPIKMDTLADIQNDAMKKSVR